MEVFGLNIPLVWTLLVGFVGLVYIYGKRRNRLLKAGFPGPESDIYLGSLRRLISEGPDFENKLGKQFGPVFAAPLGGIPLVNVFDPDILKEVLIKDFDTFTDRLDIDLANYPLDLGIFNQTGASWKRLRNIISPTFSGSKLRRMCDGLNSCAKHLIENLTVAAEKDEVIVTKDYFGAFTMDAIASTAFGIDIGSQNDFDNSFIKETRRVFDNSFLQNPVVFIAIIFPGLTPLMKKMGLGSFPKSTITFFIKSLNAIIEARKSEPKEMRKKRVDFLELMLEAEENTVTQNGDTGSDQSKDTKSHKKMTTDEILGQAFLFFIAGYETTASSLNFLSYVLATHPDVQEKLIEEIDSVIGNDEPDYDNIHNLPYMDRVITETLRLYPVVPAVNRYVSKTTTIKDWTFPEGMIINIPIPPLHRDPVVYPEPTKFKPERWETKSSTDSMNYMPFGHGPRHCIGMRLAQVEMKIALVQVLKKLTFGRADSTPDELKEFKVTGVFAPKKPIELKVKLR